MYKVIYKNDSLLLRIETEDPLEHKFLSDLLSLQYITWNRKSGAYVLTFPQLNELLAWCVNKQIHIQLSDEAKDKYTSYLEETFSPTTTFYRGRKSDKDITAFLKEGFSYNKIQLDGIIFSLSRSASFNADEQGLGKTLIGLTKIWYDLKNGIVDGYIILVMSGMSWHFVFESLKFSSYLKEEDFFICSNSNKYTVFQEAKDKKVIIIPHHLWAEVFFYADKGKGKRRQSLQRVRWSSVSTDIKKLWGKTRLGILVDESQAFKNPKAVKTKALLRSSSQFHSKLLTSATPNITSFEDIYAQVRFLDPSIIPMEYKAFKVWISKKIGTKYGYDKISVYDEKKILEVKNALSPFFIKRLKSDVEGFNYVIHDQVKYFHLSQEQLYLYKSIKEMESIRVLKEHRGKITIANISSHFPYTLQVLENPGLLRGKLEDPMLSKIVDKWTIDKDPRIEYLDAFLSDYIVGQGKKVVIFDGHPLTLDELEERYKKYNPLKIHGQMNVKDKEFYRKDVERRFNMDPKHKLLLLSTHTSRAGISVNIGSDYILFYNPPLSSEQYSQAKERIHRMNNTRDSNIGSLLFPNTFHIIQYQRNIQNDKFNNTYLNKPLSEEEISLLLSGEC